MNATARGSAMPEIKSTDDLIARLAEAAKYKMSPEEHRAQKVSFILSASGDDTGLTKERISEVLDRQEGR